MPLSSHPRAPSTSMLAGQSDISRQQPFWGGGIIFAITREACLHPLETSPIIQSGCWIRKMQAVVVRNRPLPSRRSLRNGCLAEVLLTCLLSSRRQHILRPAEHAREKVSRPKSSRDFQALPVLHLANGKAVRHRDAMA